MLRQNQHNVQEQNALRGEQKGVDWRKFIVIVLDIDFPWMPRLFGVIPNQYERFIRFEIDTGPDHRCIESIDLCGLIRRSSGRQRNRVPSSDISARGAPQPLEGRGSCQPRSSCSSASWR